MPRFTVVSIRGERCEHSLESGQTLMPALAELGLIDAVCGGGASCGTCAVSIDAPWNARLPPPAGDEAALLEGLGCSEGGRLSCQIVVGSELNGAVIRVLPQG